MTPIKNQLIREKKLNKNCMVETVSRWIYEEGMSQRAACRRYTKFWNDRYSNEAKPVTFDQIYSAYRYATGSKRNKNKKSSNTSSVLGRNVPKSGTKRPKNKTENWDETSQKMGQCPTKIIVVYEFNL